MAGHNQCCRYEASLEELLADDIMRPVLQSAGYDRERFRDLIVETTGTQIWRFGAKLVPWKPGGVTPTMIAGTPLSCTHCPSTRSDW